MDAIALLCNLYADGPTTLTVLQRAGLRSLDLVATAPSGRLAELLGTSPSQARRFAREAQLLGQRLTDAPPVDGAVARDAERAVEPVAASAPPDQGPQRASANAGDVPLAIGLLDGLDRIWCERLAAQGVRTLAQLAAAPGRSLARALDLPYPTLVDLESRAAGFLKGRAAGHTLEPRGAQAAGPERVVVLHPPVPPTARRLPADPPERWSTATALETSGPFA